MAKQIRDQAVALKVYARQRNDIEMERWVSEIKLRAGVRIGEISAELPELSRKESGATRKGLPITGKTSKKDILMAACISTSVANRCEHLAQNAGKVESYIAERSAIGKPVNIDGALRAVKKTAKKTAVKRAAHDVRREYCKTSDLASLAGQQFATIYADPPWHYGNQATRASTGEHYAGMSR